MEYVNLKTLYQEEMAVYCRVSTSSQNINQQVSLAEIYIAQNNLDTERVQYFLDDNVSANKLTSEKRPQLQKLITELKKGKIKTVLVQNRDRLTRNFYEYVELVKLLYKYEVNVVFTDSSQSPFSKVLYIESFYGIITQFEGRNISGRTNLAAKQFPASIFGFNVIGKKNSKKYNPKPELENQIKTLFYSVIESQTPKDLFEIFIENKKAFNKYEKILSCLENPFYAGYIKSQDEYVLLPHVEPIILLDEFLKVQEVLIKYKQEIQDGILKSQNTGLMHPICNVCKTRMNFRSNNLGESGYYVCTKKHPRIQISVAHYNQLIAKHLEYVLDKIDEHQLKKDVFNFLLIQEKMLKHKFSYQENQLNSLHKEITDLIGTDKIKKLKVLAKQAEKIKEEIKSLHTEMIKIDEARNGINYSIKLIKERLTKELQSYQIDYLIHLLFSTIEVSFDAVLYHTTFGKYINGEDETYEYNV